MSSSDNLIVNRQYAVCLLEQSAEALKESIRAVDDCVQKVGASSLLSKALLVHLASNIPVDDATVYEYVYHVYEGNPQWEKFCTYSIRRIEAGPRLMTCLARALMASQISGLDIIFDLHQLCAAFLVFLAKDLLLARDITKQDVNSIRGYGLSTNLTCPIPRIPTLFAEGLMLDSPHVWDMSRRLIGFLNAPADVVSSLIGDIDILQRILLPKTLGERHLKLIRSLLDEFDSHFDKIIDSTSGEKGEFRIGRIVESLILGGIDIYDSFDVVDAIRGQLLSAAEEGRLETDLVYNMVRGHLLSAGVLSLDEFVKQSSGIFVVEYPDGRVQVLSAGRKYQLLQQLIRNKFRERGEPDVASVVREIQERLNMMLPLLARIDDELRRDIFVEQSDDKSSSHKKELSFKIPYDILDTVLSFLVNISCTAGKHHHYMKRIQRCLADTKSGNGTPIENAVFALNSVRFYLCSLVGFPRSLKEEFPPATAYPQKVGQLIDSFSLEHGISIDLRKALEDAYKELHASCTRQHMREENVDQKEIIELMESLVQKLQEFHSHVEALPDS